jgi:hypothetical protein
VAADVLVLVRAGDVLLGVTTSFARVPVPGEHVLLWLDDAQRAKLGAAFRSGSATPAVVRDTVLLQSDAKRWLPPGMKAEIANVYADAIPAEQWKTKMARWALGSD